VRKHDTVTVEAAKLDDDGKTVELTLGGMKPSHQLKIAFDLETTDAKPLKSEIYATVYKD
jgi:hypothetical protein